MEAVPRMPMIWLDLKEAGEFGFHQAVKKFVLKNYGENPENYNEELKKLEQLRQNAVNVPRDFEGCSILRKYFGQLHYLQSRIPMGAEHEAAVPITWTEIFSGKAVCHEDIKYEQACILYNLGALHSMLGAMDKRVSEEGMKVSCTHFQCAAGAFTYLRDHFPHSYSVDMSHQILNLNINLMLGQAQECLLEKSMLDNRKSFLVARISAQVVDYYKEACRALENSETASLLGKIQKDWKKLVQMKIYYFAAVAHLHMGKQAEEQQKYGERVVYFQSALDKLNEAIKLAKGQPETVQEALRFTMDVIGGKFNSAKKDNDFIYHEAVPALDTLQSVKGAPLVKALPVNPTDAAPVTGPDIFAKLVPMAAHEASSLYSEEKAKLLREVMAKIDAKNEVLEQFHGLPCSWIPEMVDNPGHVQPTSQPAFDERSVGLERASSRPVKNSTVQVSCRQLWLPLWTLDLGACILFEMCMLLVELNTSTPMLSGVFTDVEASLREIKDLLDADEAQEQKLQEAVGKLPAQQGSPPPKSSSALADRWAKRVASFTNASKLHTRLHEPPMISRNSCVLLSGPLEQVRAALPTPSLTEEDKQVMQTLKRILAKVQEMKDQRVSLEQQLREMIQKDDITTSLVTTDRSEMKKLFEEQQLKKYLLSRIKVYFEQNPVSLGKRTSSKALTERLNVLEYGAGGLAEMILAEVGYKWNTTLQTLVASYEAYEDLMKKSQEGKDFYADLEGKVAKLLEKGQAGCKEAEVTRQQVLEREMKKRPPPRPTTAKPALQPKAPELELADPLPLSSLSLADLPEELRSLPPEVLAAHLAQLPADAQAALGIAPSGGLRAPGPAGLKVGRRAASAPLQPVLVGQPGVPYPPGQFLAPGPLPRHYQPPRGAASTAGIPASSGQGPFLGVLGPPSPPLLRQMQPFTTPAKPAMPPSPQRLCLGSLYASFLGLICRASALGLHATQLILLGSPIAASPTVLPLKNISSPCPLSPHTGPVYCVGQPAPAGGGLPAGHPPPLTVRPPPTAHPPFGVSSFPSPVQTIRPATTTVDSIQAPISSCSAPRGHASPLPPWAGPLPQGGLVGPPGPGLQFPCAPAGGPPHMQQVLPPFSAAQPPQGFPTHGPLHPPQERQVRPQPLAGQPAPHHAPQLPPRFLPQGRLLPQPPFQAPFAPQVSGPQPVLSQGPAHPPSQGPFPGQPGPPPYQLPPQDNLPALGLPPHSGALAFPSPVARGLNLSAGVMPHHQSLPQPLRPAPFPPSLTCCSGSRFSCFLCPLAYRTPPGGSCHALSGLLPCSHGAGLKLPQPPGLSQVSPGLLISHIPPAPSPAGPQMPGGVVVQGVALPSPAPSPQPSMAIPPPSLLPSCSCPPASAPLRWLTSPQRCPARVAMAPGAAPLLQGLSPEAQFHRQNSSTDDLLSSSPESQLGCAKASVSQPLLQPTKASAKDGLKPKAVQLIENDPYEKPEHIRRLLVELERFRDTVAGLEKPTSAGGASELDGIWKELQEAQEKDARQLSIAIARCYSMKNRHQDIMPYDKNRIVLQSGKDDYINASRIGRDLLPPTLPPTHHRPSQAPQAGQSSLPDFWLMIYEQKVSVVVMLVSEQEIEKQKVVRYFPTERGQPMVHGSITLALTSLKATPTHVERMITLQFRDQSLKRTVIHLQFSSWPELGLPDSKGDLLRFIQEVHSHYLHQRPLHTPIVVHCSSGVGRTGAFCLLYAAMQEVEAGNSIPDLAQLVKRIRRQRKHMLQEKLHLKFCYESVLKHAKQVLQRHGVTAPSAGKPASSPSQKPYVHQDPQDLVLGGDMPISSIQATIAKLSIRPPSGGSEPSANGQPSDSPPAPATENTTTLQPPPVALPYPAFADYGRSGSLELASPLSPPAASAARPEPAELSATMENSNHVEDEGEEDGESAKPLPGLEPVAAPVVAPSTSSLELLASLTPEAFTLDSSLKGRHKMSKQSFLQPQNGEGLRGTRPSDDPLSMLDPLWTLNKT
ncbi:LOW QUALITY PROTEIN: tyrosine-protein phosphatase non-receptor type 23 [Sphaerodactylus townsendi]|uniref:LOW QUALITY PROTEIN: tyrosine-protein phosphatase non-receptor type 23 n=1 Tax=Sphaerodactylus townsendi TaxID=933632 RepID=UPI002027601C|nr:LOW QUALITY PROTEIN: tyrosine-protein phosphatase non-receptor type 23 [Sphaerodactylus townsendi]